MHTASCSRKKVKVKFLKSIYRFPASFGASFEAFIEQAKATEDLTCAKTAMHISAVHWVLLIMQILFLKVTSQDMVWAFCLRWHICRVCRWLQDRLMQFNLNNLLILEFSITSRKSIERVELDVGKTYISLSCVIWTRQLQGKEKDLLFVDKLFG